MTEQLLAILKLCLLALLYLFFLRVLWAVWTEVRPARSAARSAPASARPARRAQRTKRSSRVSQLVVIEPPEQQGRSYPLADELTIGRAGGCQIPLDDTFVSQLHARVFLRDGQYLVEDIGSTNGTYLNRQKVSAPMVMHAGDRVKIGSVVLELR